MSNVGLKKLKASVEDYLETTPPFRERSNKDRGIVNLLMIRYPALDMAIETGAISKDQLISIVQDYGSMDRCWRRVLQERPELRGEDYDEKHLLEEEAKDHLGYATV